MAERVLYLIAPVSAIRKRPRLAKMVPVFRAAGLLVEFLGWERIRGECREFSWPTAGVRETSILWGGGYVTRSARAMYPLWMIVVFFRVLLLGRRKKLFCLGWETAFPATVAALFTRSIIIFDDADRFSMIVKLPRYAHRALEAAERWVSKRATVHLIPGWARYEWQHPNMVLVRNTPTTEDFERAGSMAIARPDADFVIYVNGWIGRTRGATIFLELMSDLLKSPCRIKMIAAGWTDCEEGRDLFSLPNVQFYGNLSTESALALYHACDCVLTYYDPAVPINRQAESNKWGDCIFLGKPFVVNAEVETAQLLVQQGYGYAIAYHDVNGLRVLMEQLAKQGGSEQGDVRSERKIPAGYLPFDVAIRDVLRKAGLVQV